MAAVEKLYPPKLAQEWDSVGLICGDSADEVKKILIALDPVVAVAEEAVAWGADFLLTHHPLYLRGTSSVATTSAKGKVVHMLVKSGCALMNAHTNADAADEGVAQALADLAGIVDTVPLEADPDNPALGIGRVGRLPQPVSLQDFCKELAKALPASAGGLLVGGDLSATVEKIAVSGGAGDSLMPAARQSGADVFVTADLRHHPASEHLEEGKPYLVCGTHWATESPWTAYAAKALQKALAPFGQVEIKTSKLVTEPWVEYFSTRKEDS